MLPKTQADVNGDYPTTQDGVPIKPGMWVLVPRRVQSVYMQSVEGRPFARICGTDSAVLSEGDIGPTNLLSENGATADNCIERALAKIRLAFPDDRLSISMEMWHHTSAEKPELPKWSLWSANRSRNIAVAPTLDDLLDAVAVYAEKRAAISSSDGAAA